MNQLERLSIEKIRINGGTQVRSELNQETLEEYVRAIVDGAEFPPVTVYHDGVDYWLADGFHRYFAHKQVGSLNILADIRIGTQRDAVLYAVGANAQHGLKRSNADKRRAVETLLRDSEWCQWSDREIARACVVSPDTVGRIRKEGVNIKSSPQELAVTDAGNSLPEGNNKEILTVRSDSEKPEAGENHPAQSREPVNGAGQSPANSSPKETISGAESDDNQERTYITKHGTQAVMKTGNIGKKAETKGEDDQVASDKAKEELYGDFDPIAELELANKEIDRLTKIVESDDALATAVAENKRLAALVDVLEERMRGYQVSENEAKRAAQSWKNKFDRLERQVKAAGMVDF